MSLTSTLPSYCLSLADGARWLIRAGDPDAERVVSGMAKAMQLQPSHYGAGGRGEGLPPAGHELIVLIQRGQSPLLTNLDGPGPAVCTLPPLFNDAMLDIRMSLSALVIAREAQSRGGVLLHGALAEHRNPEAGENPLVQGQGILLAGAGSMGKTTASNRLPPPWCSLSDDAALVVRDSAGQYWAHPWPTWSRFYDNGPGGSWDVQRAVPLRAVFFLSQSPEDMVEPMQVTQCTAMLMEVVQHLSLQMRYRLPRDETQTLYLEQLAAVEALARAIPAYTLHLSRTGEFWKEIERALAELLPLQPFSPRKEGTSPSSFGGRDVEGEGTIIDSSLDHGALYVVYTGPSMNPTLTEPDLLEVVPYDSQPVQPGDVIYFQPPEGYREVVHRVVAVTAAGVRTRGDNNPSEDPYLLQPGDIVGQVVAARRGQRQRRIAGGRRGMWVGYGSRLWRLINRVGSRLLHGAYRALAGAGRFRHLLPANLQPRVFIFWTRHQTFLKLLMAGRVVGQYDVWKEQWHIRRPFRLFVDEASLPVVAPMDRSGSFRPTWDVVRSNRTGTGES